MMLSMMTKTMIATRMVTKTMIAMRMVKLIMIAMRMVMKTCSIRLSISPKER